MIYKQLILLNDTCCNVKGEISTQIVKGASVPNITAFPYYVGIMSGNSIKCNGALIDDDWVLTSAFCASLCEIHCYL